MPGANERKQRQRNVDMAEGHNVDPQAILGGSRVIREAESQLVLTAGQHVLEEEIKNRLRIDGTEYSEPCEEGCVVTPARPSCHKRPVEIQFRHKTGQPEAPVLDFQACPAPESSPVFFFFFFFLKKNKQKKR